jgi:hypothetical protein
MAEWTPFREPLRTTLTRTIGIAVVVGGVLSLRLGGISRWPLATVLLLWPSFGGHWIDLWFLNWLRPRLPSERSVQVVSRLVVWFVGGMILGLGMGLTALAFGVHRPASLPWWIAGLAFIAIELVAQIALQLRGRPSFFNGQG